MLRSCYVIDSGLGLSHHSRMDSELLCPACRLPLTEMRTGKGILFHCEKCDGRAVSLGLLRDTFTPESINPLWLHAIHDEGQRARPCPSCGNAMIEIALDNTSGIRVEVCRICEFVWFDAGETQTLQPRPIPKKAAPLTQKAREAIAKVKALAEEARGPDFDSAAPG
jgi:Zn-finger nucleic acid-binding protein